MELFCDHKYQSLKFVFPLTKSETCLLVAQLVMDACLSLNTCETGLVLLSKTNIAASQ